MRVFVSILSFVAAVGLKTAELRAAAALPAVRVESVASPAATGATGSSLVTAPDGTVWLAWIESAADETVLRCATFDAAGQKWSEARTIARGADWFTGSSADFPALTVGENGRATALWYIVNPPSVATAHLHHGAGYHAVISQTGDGGRTWSAPAPLSRESDMVEFASLATLADGRVLAAWLDGRAKKAAPAHAHGTPGPAQRLYASIVGADGPDLLVDPSVCDCCQTSLTPFLDGSALLAYRGRTAEEARDIRLARFRGNAWDDSRPLNHDDWRILACPVNGPQLASDGGRVAAAWFTASNNDPRVLASFSPDAGGRFLMPLRMGQAKPAGRVDTLLLRDGALLVTWVDAEGGFWLGRITPDFAPSPATRLAPAGAVKGFPRIALLQDYRGGTTPAKLIVTFTEGTPSTVRTLLITVPEGELIEAERVCVECAPTLDQLVGFPVRGTIVAAAAGAGSLRVNHGEVPGVFAAGTRDFKADPAVLASLPAGRRFLGRVEKREGAWWLYDVRLLATAPAQ